MALIEEVSVAEELKKNPELKESDLQMLREWCSKQPHLPKLTDFELVMFLHSNYHRMEPTKTTIDTYYTVRTHVPEFFSNQDPLGCKGLRQMARVVEQMALPGKTPEGYKVYYSRLVITDPSQFIYNESMKYFIMLMDLWLRTEGTAAGHILVIDMKGAALGHIGRVTPMGLKKFLFYLQEALPIRLKSLHFVNTNPVMDILLAMMKPFMKQDLLDILHLHPTYDTFAKFVPLDMLPSDMGGKNTPAAEIHQKYWKKMEDHRAFFQYMEQTGRVNESLRPGKSKNATDLFGVEGSFKKLDID